MPTIRPAVLTPALTGRPRPIQPDIPADIGSCLHSHGFRSVNGRLLGSARLSNRPGLSRLARSTMQIVCPNCATSYQVTAAAIGAGRAVGALRPLPERLVRPEPRASCRRAPAGEAAMPHGRRRERRGRCRVPRRAWQPHAPPDLPAEAADRRQPTRRPIRPRPRRRGLRYRRHDSGAAGRRRSPKCRIAGGRGAARSPSSDTRGDAPPTSRRKAAPSTTTPRPTSRACGRAPPQRAQRAPAQTGTLRPHCRCHHPAAVRRDRGADRAAQRHRAPRAADGLALCGDRAAGQPARSGRSTTQDHQRDA